MIQYIIKEYVLYQLTPLTSLRGVTQKIIGALKLQPLHASKLLQELVSIILKFLNT